jgi:uncharacterized phage protein gp47/JayE
MALTEEGFERTRLAEFKEQLDQRMNNALGPVNTGPDAVVGQIDGILAEAFDNFSEALQDVYDSLYPYSAEGTSLDGAVALVGLSRLPATYTTVNAVAYGAEGTLVAAGSLARADIQYSSTSDVVISRASVVDAEIQVGAVAASTAYQIIAGGVSETYTSSASPTEEEILNGLAAQFDPLQVTAVVNGLTLRLTSADKITPFALTVDSKLNITKRGSPIVFVASSTGANAVPIGALSIIDTPTLGWDSVTNLVIGDVGRNVETDIELRLRHASSVRSTGSATVEAIKARMLADVPAVTSIKIYENRTSVTSSDGIPPHAFESVIVGGNDQAIGNELWLVKPAGIETHGNVTVTVQDSAGDAQIVKFSRAVSKYGWITVAVTALNSEETLPTDAAAAIKQAVVDYANANLNNGDDVILQRFYGPIYDSVPGIGQMTITGAITASPGDTPTYSASNIVIGKSERAVFDISRVVVTGV